MNWHIFHLRETGRESILSSKSMQLQLQNNKSITCRRCYKILFGHVKICSPNFFEFRLSSTRGHPYKLFKHHCSNTARSVFFAERVINAWNNLPSDTVDFSTLKSFKRSIQTMDLSGYCIGSI